MYIATRYEEMEKKGHLDLVSLQYIYVHAYTSVCVYIYIYIYVCECTCVSLQDMKRWRGKTTLILSV